jgi:hypothetical protein
MTVYHTVFGDKCLTNVHRPNASIFMFFSFYFSQVRAFGQINLDISGRLKKKKRKTTKIPLKTNTSKRVRGKRARQTVRCGDRARPSSAPHAAG